MNPAMAAFALRSDPRNGLWRSHSASRIRIPGEESPRVSVVITARNYARFLPEAIESALGQTVPCEVLYSDDYSEDESVAVARRFEKRGVTVLTTTRHLGVCEARNRGAVASTGAFLVHLDGDDMLTPDFAERHLNAMAPGIPFVYGPALAFGQGPEAGTLWRVPTWEKADPWRRNSVNTSAMYARWAFEAAGRWREGAGTMWDWDLALRAARFGTPHPSDAVLHYRQHAASWSRKRGARAPGYIDVRPSIRRQNVRLSVGSVVSGRLPGLFERWFQRLANSVSLLDLAAKPDLTILDNSRDERKTSLLREATERHADVFSTIKVVPHPATFSWKTERERRDGVAMFMANAHNRLRESMRGDVHWIVEDDVLVPPHAGTALFEELTGERIPHAVSGCYRCRHGDGSWIAGWHAKGTWKRVGHLGDAPLSVDYTGTGCLMFWKNRTPETWQSHTSDGVAAHDWAWGLNLTRQGGMLLLLPSVRCEHAISETRQI